jgi:hypothetical protein
MQIRHGMKTFYKGTVTITEDEVRTLENEPWNIRFAEITTAKGETPKPPEANYTIYHFRNPAIPELQEISDEEKCWNFAKVLESLSCPIMKTEEGKKIFREAEHKIGEAIEILKK